MTAGKKKKLQIENNSKHLHFFSHWLVDLVASSVKYPTLK